jgi:hypothetical protein
MVLKLEWLLYNIILRSMLLFNIDFICCMYMMDRYFSCVFFFFFLCPINLLCFSFEDSDGTVSSL